MTDLLNDSKEQQNNICGSCANLNVLKLREDHGAHVKRVNGFHQELHGVVQREQGTDFVVEPVTGEQLQGNHQGWAAN